MTPEEAFEDVRAEFDGLPDVADGRMFRTEGLKFRGRFFVALSRGELLVKLPEDRVTDLIDSGIGLPFDANKGRPMREWLLVPTSSIDRWPAIAQEAFAFARARVAT